MILERIQDMQCSHSVQRHIPAHVRVIQCLLYAAVILLVLLGAMGGLHWSILAVATLVFSWYYMGVARTSFIYELSGTRLRIQRVSGFASRPKTEAFAQFDLTGMRIMAPEGVAALEAEDEATRALRPKRVVYDLTSHDRNMPAMDNVEGATNYSNNGGSSWAITQGTDVELAADFMQLYRNVEFYNKILPTTSAIATFAPAKEGEAYSAPSEFFNGTPIFATILEYGEKVPSNITGAYYYDARNAVSTAVTNAMNGGDIDALLAEAEDTVNFAMGF